MSLEEDRRSLKQVRYVAGLIQDSHQEFGMHLAKTVAEDLSDVDPMDRARLLLHIGKTIGGVTQTSGNPISKLWSNALLVAAVNQGVEL